MSHIGQEIRRRRLEKSWNQAQLAVYAQMAPSAINQIETGTRTPTIGSVEKIAAALGASVPDLIIETYRPKATAPPSYKMSDEVIEERRALFAVSARAIEQINERFGPYLTQLPPGPTPEEWGHYTSLIKEVFAGVAVILEAFAENRVREKFEPYVEAMAAGESVPEPLQQPVRDLYNALHVFFLRVVPLGRNWANRSDEIAELDAIDTHANEWKEAITTDEGAAKLSER